MHTTGPIAGSPAFPATGTFRVKIVSTGELLAVTAVSGNDFTVTRQDGASVLSGTVLAGATIEQVLTKEALAAAFLRADQATAAVVAAQGFQASGVGQFSTPGRFLGILGVVGAPTSGTYTTGDWGFDSNLNQWICTSGGTPGSWRASGPHFLAIQSGALSTYDFTSIPSAYRTLELKCKLRDNSTATSSGFVDLIFNGDSGNNYNQELQVADATNLAAAESLGRANIQAMLSSGGNQAAGCYCTATIEIASYSDTNSRKAVSARIAQDNGDATTNTATRILTGRWRTLNQAVNRVTLTPEQGTGFDLNSYAELWGLW